MKMRRRTTTTTVNGSIVAWSTLLVAVVGFTMMGSTGASSEAKTFSRFVDAEGGIRLPEDFRKNMVHLGSWFVPTGDASGFHDVYTEASTVDAYRKTGEFPDGATLVKELRASTAGTYTTGANVSFANDTLKKWFVMIRDRQGRFSDNPNWGEGWGWALIEPNDPSKNLSSNYQASCLGCHIPAKANDWVYVEAYPTLK